MKQTIYDRSPVFIQNILCSIYGFFEKKKRFNSHFNSTLEFLIQSDFMSEDAIEEYKTKALINVLVAAKNSPFYKSLNDVSLDEINCNPWAVLESMPVLTKDDLAKFVEQVKFNSKTMQKVSTSGTTGRALSVMRDKNFFSFQWAVWFRHRHRFGIKIDDLSVNFTGKPVVPIIQKFGSFWRYNLPLKQYLIGMQHINKNNIKSIINFLNQITPSFYSGYPSIISELARLAISQNLFLNEHAKPKVIFTGAEKLLVHQKDAIEKWLGSNVIITDQYGLTEGNCNFSKCEYGVYHEDFEFCHIEKPLLKKDASIPLISTSFINELVPIIKYNTGDFVRFPENEQRCKCGRSSQIICDVDGRKDDYVELSDGNRIMRFDYLFKDTFEVLEAQVIQKKKNQIEILAVLINNTEKDKITFESKVKHHFKEYISSDIEIVFNYTDAIPKSPTGKFKAVLNLMDKNK